VAVSGCPSTFHVYAEDDNQTAFYMKTAYAPTVDLSGMQPTGTMPTTLSATHVPTGAQVDAELRMVANGATLYTTGPQNVATNPANVNLPVVQGPDELVIASMSSTTGTVMLAHREPYTASSKIIDATNTLPYVSAPTFTPMAITWQELSQGPADFVVATLRVTPVSGDPYLRAIVAPHSGASLPIPLLSGSDAYYNIAAADHVTGAQALVAAPGGYDALRPRVFTFKNPIEAAPSSGAPLALSYAGAAPSIP
jgi:hypothetical protein